MRTVELTIVGDRRCSTTRTYLTYLAAAGLRPRRLWLVDFYPAGRDVRIARRIFGARWANRLHRRACPAPVVHNHEFMQLCDALQTALPRRVDLFGEFDFAAYADEVESLCAEDFDDPYLQHRIRSATDTAYLYTNGGRVPSKLLDAPGVRIFHIHPGIVPDVRGSDCLLWSCLVRGRVGVSCFYMSSGIDEGDVIAQAEYALPDIAALRPFLTNETEETAYRALLFAVDPHYRAQLFAAVLAGTSERDLKSLAASRQPQGHRPAYLWMHPRLRLMTMRRMANA